MSAKSTEKKGTALGEFATAPTYLLTRSGVEGCDDLIEQRDVELGLGEIEDCLCVFGARLDWGSCRVQVDRWRGETNLHWGEARSWGIVKRICSSYQRKSGEIESLAGGGGRRRGGEAGGSAFHPRRRPDGHPSAATSFLFRASDRPPLIFRLDVRFNLLSSLVNLHLVLSPFAQLMILLLSG